MITIYGIPNCDSVKKARTWFADHGVEHTFHDFRKDGMDAAWVTAWLASSAGDKVINTRGPSWRKLSDDDKAAAQAGDTAVFLANPTIIKRPVVVKGDTVVIGVDEAAWDALSKA